MTLNDLLRIVARTSATTTLRQMANQQPRQGQNKPKVSYSNANKAEKEKINMSNIQEIVEKPRFIELEVNKPEKESRYQVSIPPHMQQST